MYLFSIGFANSSQLVVLKEAITDSTQVILSIVRDGGTIGVSQVYWNITNTNNDLQPLEGTVMFLSGDSVKTITISSVPDEIPELEEVYCNSSTWITNMYHCPSLPPSLPPPSLSLPPLSPSLSLSPSLVIHCHFTDCHKWYH